MKIYGKHCCRECGREFEAEELRYRANDGYDYCTDCGSAQRKWTEENGSENN